MNPTEDRGGEMKALIERLDDAVARLNTIRVQTGDTGDRTRLAGKVSGLRLARRYAMEMSTDPDTVGAETWIPTPKY